jgi:hypothetical protein
MSDKTTEKKGEKRIPISAELAAVAQSAYAENAKREAQQAGQPTKLGLQPGWGGQGR